MNGNANGNAKTDTDWSMCRKYWVPVKGYRSGGPTFTNLRKLLDWLGRHEYNGVIWYEVMALNPGNDGPVWLDVPKEVVDRWMGVA